MVLSAASVEMTFWLGIVGIVMVRAPIDHRGEA
jgi:hypothetical protein